MKIIINKKAKKNIKNHMKKNNVTYTKSTFDEIINKIHEIIEPYKSELPAMTTITIHEYDGFNGNCNRLSNKNMLFIGFTWLWAYKLTFEYSPEIKDAFIMNLGHELGHSITKTHIPMFLFSKSILKKGTKCDMFRLQSIEVFCDFYGKKLSGLTSEAAVNVREYCYKINYDIKKGENMSDYIHPQHEKRMSYLKNKSFDRKLIYQIANDIGYKNQKVIEHLVQYFDEVQRRGTYIQWYQLPLDVASISFTVSSLFLSFYLLLDTISKLILSFF